MITAEVAYQTSLGDRVFTVRPLATSEVREILATGEADLLWQVLNGMVPNCNVDLRHRIEIIVRATLDPEINYVTAIFLARDDRAAFMHLSDEVLEISCQARGFESVAAIHQKH